MILLGLAACKVPAVVGKTENKTVPAAYAGVQDTANTGSLPWKLFFTDENLVALIDTALANNQELNILLQEIQISNNEIHARKGEYLPFVNIGAAAGVEKVGRYTSQGANDANTEIKPGKEFPEPLGDLMVGAFASWEVDIWHKLRNAKKVAVLKYLSTMEGRNFMTTHLIAEIAESYYELMALDNQLEILRNNISIQQNALEIVKAEKASARTTELAVKKFEAEVLKNKGRQYAILQAITEAENRVNFLVGRFPQPVRRQSSGFTAMEPQVLPSGIPAQLLQNRTDIRQAELELEAAKLDVQVARANFYPSVKLTAGFGLQAFNPKYVFMPESILYSLAGELAAPLINRNAIEAAYRSANAKQIQAVYHYERAILQAYIEVVNQVSAMSNLAKSYDTRLQEVAALTESIDISGVLYKSARADYMEVLMTQRDALDAKFDLVENKMQQMIAMVQLYQALGGGWK